MYSLAILDDDQNIVFALSRGPQVILHQSLPESSFSEQFPALLKERQISLSLSDRLILLEEPEGGLVHRLWSQRRRTRWLESLGLHLLKWERMEPGQALAARAFQKSNFSRSAVLCFNSREGSHQRLQLWWADQGQMKLLWSLKEAPPLSHFLEQLAEHCGFLGERAFDQFHDLASYGEPRFVESLLRHSLEWSAGGQLCRRSEEVELNRWLGGPARRPDQPVTAREIDLAASLELLLKKWAQNISRELNRQLKVNHLCLTGDWQVGYWLKSYLDHQKPPVEAFVHSGSLKEEMVMGASLFQLTKEKKTAEVNSSSLLVTSSGLDPATVGGQHLSVDGRT